MENHSPERFGTISLFFSVVSVVMQIVQVIVSEFYTWTDSYGKTSMEMTLDWAVVDQCQYGETLFRYNKTTGEHRWESADQVSPRHMHVLLVFQAELLS